jgi:hypothetical protein
MMNVATRSCMRMRYVGQGIPSPKPFRLSGTLTRAYRPFFGNASPDPRPVCISLPDGGRPRFLVMQALTPAQALGRKSEKKETAGGKSEDLPEMP